MLLTCKAVDIKAIGYLHIQWSTVVVSVTTKMQPK